MKVFLSGWDNLESENPALEEEIINSCCDWIYQTIKTMLPFITLSTVKHKHGKLRVTGKMLIEFALSQDYIFKFDISRY